MTSLQLLKVTSVVVDLLVLSLRRMPTTSESSVKDASELVSRRSRERVIFFGLNLRSCEVSSESSLLDDPVLYSDEDELSKLEPDEHDLVSPLSSDSDPLQLDSSDG